MNWLEITPGSAPLIISIPHAGTEIPEPYQPALNSLWLARKDADWWLPQLYAFAENLGATIIRTHISRTIIDVNRDPSGASLYPGQNTTELCPTTTFDGEPLYKPAQNPENIQARREQYFDPYHAAIQTEISRLSNNYPNVILYDCHSIRSKIPRLFDGELPNFNIGTNQGASCDPSITEKLVTACATNQKFTHILNGRFTGGYITRHHANPKAGIHAIQMEIACRTYMPEPETITETNWPPEYNPAYAAPAQKILKSILESLAT